MFDLILATAEVVEETEQGLGFKMVVIYFALLFLVLWSPWVKLDDDEIPNPTPR